MNILTFLITFNFFLIKLSQADYTGRFESKIFILKNKILLKAS
jgi:hypothetical protein